MPATALLVSALTGLRIAADAPAARLAQGLEPITLQGRVYRLHCLAGVTVAGVAVGYAVYPVRGRLAGRLALTRAKAMLDRCGMQAWRARKLQVYYLLFALIGVLAVSGLTLYLDAAPPVAAEPLLVAHLSAAYGLIAAAALHVVTQYAFGAARSRAGVGRARSGLAWLLKMLRPRFGHGAPVASVRLQSNPAAVALAVGVVAVTGGGLLALDGTGADLRSDAEWADGH